MSRKDVPKDASAPPTTFEARFATLEEAIRKLEEGSLPLEESLAVYESGVKALQECYTILGQAEKKIEKLVKGAEGQLKTVPMDVPRSDEAEKAQRRKRGGAAAASEEE